jgi:hypothetical protein
MNQFLDHLAEDVLPALIEKLSEAKAEPRKEKTQ